jgi:hypothetical protein
VGGEGGGGGFSRAPTYNDTKNTTDGNRHIQGPVLTGEKLDNDETEDEKTASSLAGTTTHLVSIAGQTFDCVVNDS